MGHIQMSVVMAKRRGEGRASGKAISTDIESLTIGEADSFQKKMQVKIGMNKSLLLFLFFVLHTCEICAQELTVKSFKLAENDISAQTQPRKDLNDRNCALVKVQFVGVISEVEGNVVKPLVKHGNETWVYMPQGSRQLKLLTQSYLPVMVTFADYGVEKLVSNRTYVLVITKPMNSVGQQKQMLTIRYTPSSATVLVDNKMVRGSNGVAKTTMPVGQHSYVVFCDGYESEEGTVKLKASAPSDLQIRLSKEAVAAVSNTAAESNTNDVIQDNVSASSTSSSQSATTSSSFSSTSSVSSGSNEISIPVKNGISIDMVKVEAGTFMMGATSEMQYPEDDEKPVHQVTLTNDYYMGKYEVTQALWQVVMGSNPSKFKGDDLPVDQVSWNDCQEFISKLNSMTGRMFRLPSEAEWEYAARGGKKSRGYQYSGSSNISDVAWYCENSAEKTHPVGTKQANELGLYDMTGNVWEWCQDWYGSYVSSSQTNPTGAVSGWCRVIRDGSCYGFARNCRSSIRGYDAPDNRNDSLGLRLVLSE